MKYGILVLACLMGGTAVRAEEVHRREAVISMDYHGNRRLDFPPLADHVRLRVNQAPVRISSQLGLVQYKPGFQYPLTIRFLDKIRLADEEFEPRDLENAPALLRFIPDQAGGYRQDLLLNPNVYFDRPQAFDRILDRQLTFIVLNEAMGPDSLNLPKWIRQGLATYTAGSGEELLRREAQMELEQARAEQGGKPIRNATVKPRRFVQDLEGEFTSHSQSQYFLAIRFIEKKGGVTGLQNFVRNLIEGKSVNDALDYAIGMDLDTFKRNLQIYSNQVFEELTKDQA